MSIAPVVLDDLTWNDLTAAALRRIPAASAGRWTLHAPVDPGITLMELHAWLLEQRLYWMNAVPDALTAGALALLGDAPLGAACAATVLYFPASATGVVAAGTAMRLQDSEPGLDFTTDAATLLLPVAAGSGARPLLGLTGNGAELGGDLLAGRPVCLFAGTSEITLTLPLSEPIGAAVGGEMTLLLLLDAGVPAEWSTDAVDGVAPPAVLSWWYVGAGGATLPLPGVQDGTGGLRRSGIVRFAPPADWQAGATIGNNLPYALSARIESGFFTAPPRLLGVWPNVAIARHRRMVARDLKLQWLKLPGNSIALAADETPPIADGTTVTLNEADGVSHIWYPTADLGLHGRLDRVFTIDRAAGVLRFGDGEAGRLPVLGPDGAACLSVAIGGGGAGNVGALRNWGPADGSPSPPALNVVAAEGGAEPEAMDAARARAAGELRRIERAVLAGDYKALAIATPGVAIARARAVPGYHPGFPCLPVPGAITVFVVPAASRDTEGCAPVPAPVPDPGALAAVAARLDAARLLAAEVIVRPPIYVPVRLAVDLQANGAADALRHAVSAGLFRFLDPLAGGEMGTGWPFGELLRPSVLLRQAQDAIGDAGDVVRIAIDLPDAVPPVLGEDCQDVRIGENALPALQQVIVRVGAALPGAGGLS